MQLPYSTNKIPALTSRLTAIWLISRSTGGTAVAPFIGPIPAA